MNEILFRGKRMDTGCSWVYGCYVYDEDGDHYIIEVEGSSFISPKIKVIPETVGQYIGRYDNNSRKIFSKDICKNGDYEADAHVYNYRIETVKWDNNNGCWMGWNHNEDGMNCEVIGNVLEHPELIKEPVKA